MKISTLPTKDSGSRYLVMNDDGEIICSFGTLTQAALVMRYLHGADMPPDDCLLAVTAMQVYDSDNIAWRAERDAKRAARRQAKKQPAEAPDSDKNSQTEGEYHVDAS